MYMNVFKMDRESATEARNRRLNLTDGNEVHQWITGRQNQDRAAEKLLYRVKHENDALYLYVQSETPFNCRNTAGRGLKFMRQFEVEDTLKDVAEGDAIVFDMVVSPQHEVNNRRVFISNADERTDWVTQKLDNNGLHCTAIVENEHGDIRFSKRQKDKSIRNIRIPCSQYTGYGVVTDKTAFLDLLKNGIGKNKCYGTGLMMASRVG